MLTLCLALLRNQKDFFDDLGMNVWFKTVQWLNFKGYEENIEIKQILRGKKIGAKKNWG